MIEALFISVVVLFGLSVYLLWRLIGVIVAQEGE